MAKVVHSAVLWNMTSAQAVRPFTRTSTKFFHRTTLSARKPASFWREKRDNNYRHFTTRAAKWRENDEKMSERQGIHGLARHFFVILPSCYVASLRPTARGPEIPRSEFKSRSDHQQSIEQSTKVLESTPWLHSQLVRLLLVGFVNLLYLFELLLWSSKAPDGQLSTQVHPRIIIYFLFFTVINH